VFNSTKLALRSAAKVVAIFACSPLIGALAATKKLEQEMFG